MAAAVEAGITLISLITFAIPATPAASRAASVRCASLLTLPLSVASPFATETCTGCPAMALSAESTPCTLVVRAASVGAEDLHPARASRAHRIAGANVGTKLSQRRIFNPNMVYFLSRSVALFQTFQGYVSMQFEFYPLGFKARHRGKTSGGDLASSAQPAFGSGHLLL
jgi:hypothetical protein